MPGQEAKHRLEAKVDELVIAMEKMKLAEYVEYLHNTRKMLAINLMAGVARGLGMAIGFTILGAVVLYLLQKIVLLNLPLIGNFIAEIVEMVNEHMQTKP
ncbi:hypothetical protein BR63_06800 [Thermanaerosceptrum fracticalcis]|uniref:Uncharacterized protein n=1 Tax=Thermanaerosceptrum fracticalcis TaxID=1712410 RepID=A0A7G6E1U7_THEFR|nr:DUF5665 domain-containing protein [Thermanaerosceptrum fracticalcis]QNB46051.1 hypothetical protein BR63_06800 [Thermanaerosceptrum fracticalcis]